MLELPYLKNDTLLLTRAATKTIERTYRPGYRYSKAEVLLIDLRLPGEFTDDLFARTQPESSDRLMDVMDSINGRRGRGTVRVASVPASLDWGVKRKMGHSFTTRIDQLWKVKCD